MAYSTSAMMSPISRDPSATWLPPTKSIANVVALKSSMTNGTTTANILFVLIAVAAYSPAATCIRRLSHPVRRNARTMRTPAMLSRTVRFMVSSSRWSLSK